MEKYPQGSPRGGEDELPNPTDQRLPDNGNGQTTTTAVCRCGKICKNSRGLKIHQARMKCWEHGCIILTGCRTETWRPFISMEVAHPAHTPKKFLASGFTSASLAHRAGAVESSPMMLCVISHNASRQWERAKRGLDEVTRGHDKNLPRMKFTV